MLHCYTGQLRQGDLAGVLTPFGVPGKQHIQFDQLAMVAAKRN